MIWYRYSSSIIDTSWCAIDIPLVRWDLTDSKIIIRPLRDGDRGYDIIHVEFNKYESVLFQGMAWHLSGAKPIPESKMTPFIDPFTCVTRPEWVNLLRYFVNKKFSMTYLARSTN